MTPPRSGPKPACSVIVPAHNAERFLPLALASVARQTASPGDLEVVVVDDASTDGTAGRARAELGRLRCASQLVSLGERRGAGYARNVAIERASAELLLLLDADDELEPDAVTETLRFVRERPGVAYVWSRLSRIDARGSLLGRKPGVARFSRQRLLHYNFVSHLKCFTREVHRRIGGFCERTHCEDYDHALRASEVLGEDQFAHHPRYLYRHRLHGHNRSYVEAAQTRAAAAQAIEASLRRVEGLVARVAYSHRVERGGDYAYYRHSSPEGGADAPPPEGPHRRSQQEPA